MNKTEINAGCKRIIAETVHGERIGEDDERFVRALIAYHPERDEKVGVGISGVTVCMHVVPTGSGGVVTTPCMFIIRMDGSEIDFSYGKCTAKGNMTVEQGRNFTW